MIDGGLEAVLLGLFRWEKELDPVFGSHRLQPRDARANLPRRPVRDDRSLGDRLTNGLGDPAVDVIESRL